MDITSYFYSHMPYFPRIEIDRLTIEMRGKAQRDSPVLVLLLPPGEYG